jgi:shikimate dehydrogenase
VCPVETPLLREARARGLRAAGGLDMLVHQGALSFSLWTGVAPPLELMRAAASVA